MRRLCHRCLLQEAISNSSRNCLNGLPKARTSLLEEVQMNQRKLVQILQPSSASKIALPINDANLESAETVWQILASIPPTCRRLDKKYYVPAKGGDFLFAHLPPNLLVVDATNQCGKPTQFRLTPQARPVWAQSLFYRHITI